MAALKPRVISDPPIEVGRYPAAELSARIRSLTASKDVLKNVTVRAVFESVLGILTLVRVGGFRLIPNFAFTHR